MSARPPAIRQTGRILVQEIGAALRSRSAAVVLLLFLSASVLSMNGALTALRRIETQLASTLRLPPPAEPGALIESLRRSDRIRPIVLGIAGSESLAAELAELSPIVLLYAGLAFLYAPLLAVLAAAPRLAEELGRGSARFALLRTSRGAWSAGKALGQVGLIAIALTMSAAGAWTVVRFRMPGADAFRVAIGFAAESLRVLAYTLPFLGLALGVSQSCRSGGRATGLALAALFGLGLLAWVAAQFEGDSGFGLLWAALRPCTPQAYRADLWARAPARAAPAAASLAALGVAYWAAGFAVLRRRDV